MNDLAEVERQLPDTLEDLTQFVLVGKAKLQAYMLKLQTINKLSTAQEIRDQTLKEAQEISTALIAAEQRIGDLLLAIPKQSGGDHGNQWTGGKNLNVSNFAKTKSETIKEQGYSKDEASQYQRMAENPEIVQRVIEEAIANGEVVTKTQVLKEIKAEKDRAKAELQDLREERDYYQSKYEDLEKAMEDFEPVTVVPDDYEDLKKKARLTKATEKDLETEKRRVDEKQREILKLQDRIAELEGATQEGLEFANLSENIFYFCTICNNFISNVGGLVWLTERIADMPAKEKEMYLKAARSFSDWSQVFRDNLERNLYGAETRTDSGIPLLTD